MPIHGITHVRIHGLHHGISRGASMAGVTQDATSLKFVPANATEWTTTMAAAGIGSGNPSALYLYQEASGNLADSIGSFTLTAAGSPSYQQAVTGWTRKKISLTDGLTGNFSSTSASLPDIGSGSLLTIAYCDMPTAGGAALRNFIEYGTNATRCALEWTTGAKIEGRSAGNFLNGTSNPTSAVRPLVLKCDRTNSVVTAYSDQEKVTPTFGGTMAGQRLDFFAVPTGQASAGCGFLYAATFFNAAAVLTDAQVKTLLTVLGWTIAW
jgi:hypothetical protein